MVDDAAMSFGDHLEELRKCLILALIGVAVATVACLIFGLEILKFICKPLLEAQAANNMPPTIQALSPTAGFTAYLKIGILSGMIIAMPWVIMRVWKFVVTGLYPKERKFFKWLVIPSTLLFVGGVTFMYSIVLPIVLHFFISFNEQFGQSDITPSAFQALLGGLETEDQELAGESSEGTPPLPASIPLLTEDPENPEIGTAWFNTTTHRLIVNTKSGTWSVPMELGTSSPVMQSQFAIDFYISFVLMLSLAFGLAFETPLVVYFLAITGLVSTSQMRKARRYVLFGVICFAALLTPPDIISQMLLAGPMYLLFEAGLLAASLSTSKSES